MEPLSEVGNITDEAFRIVINSSALKLFERTILGLYNLGNGGGSIVRLAE